MQRTKHAMPDGNLKLATIFPEQTLPTFTTMYYQSAFDRTNNISDLKFFFSIYTAAGFLGKRLGWHLVYGTKLRNLLKIQ